MSYGAQPGDDLGSPGWYAGPEVQDGWCGELCAPADTAIRWTADPQPGSTIEIRCVSIAPSPGCAP